MPIKISQKKFSKYKWTYFKSFPKPTPYLNQNRINRITVSNIAKSLTTTKNENITVHVQWILKYIKAKKATS